MYVCMCVPVCILSRKWKSSSNSMCSNRWVSSNSTTSVCVCVGGGGIGGTCACVSACVYLCVHLTVC